MPFFVSESDEVMWPTMGARVTIVPVGPGLQCVHPGGVCYLLPNNPSVPEHAMAGDSGVVISRASKSILDKPKSVRIEFN